MWPMLSTAVKPITFDRMARRYAILSARNQSGCAKGYSPLTRTPSHVNTAMKIEQTPIPGLLILTPRCFGDERGFFSEIWNQQRFADAGIEQIGRAHV